MRSRRQYFPLGKALSIVSLLAQISLFPVAAIGAAPAGGPAVSPTPATSPTPAPLRVALVYDIGGRGDKSFNDLAYAGLERARSELGIQYRVAEPTGGQEREVHLRRFAAGDAEVIVGVGFLFSDDIARIAAQFPQKKFICIDYTVKPGEPIPPNLLGLRFRENEGSFLVGAIAGLFTKTKRVGFVGGAESPLIKKFEAGYVAGVRQVCPDCNVSVAYAGVTGKAFTDPAKGKELALAMYQAGADVIYHASGSTGLGVFKAAEEQKKFAIGVDADQSGEAAPGIVITSMLKKVDEALFRALKDAGEGRFQGGRAVEMGLRDGALDYVWNDTNRELLGPAIRERVEDLKARIIRGEIVVPAE
ncbi:MAG: BMP family ABC transporter substrate-binding protein [Candidatus Sumerlaeia bacterium]